MTIEKPGEYGMSADAYHADPCPTPALSSSVAKILLSQTPLHAWTASPRLNPNYKRDEKPAFSLGTAAHRGLMGEGADYRILGYDEFRTKEAKAAREECIAAGLTPLSREQGARMSEMVDLARDFIEASSIGLAFDSARHERVFAWQSDGIWRRAMLDALAKDHTIIFDYKTTSSSADPHAFGRAIANLGYDVQAAHYVDAVQSVRKVRPRFIWIVQETSAPFAVSLIEATARVLEIGSEKLARASRMWKACVEADAWPGYSREIVPADLPFWHERRHEEEEAEYDLASRDGDPTQSAISLDKLMLAG
ncbi:MAG: PD-(D/E)XK nuclease-like domain-containing protein [Pseudomonadota bacterium]